MLSYCIIALLDILFLSQNIPKYPIFWQNCFFTSFLVLEYPKKYPKISVNILFFGKILKNSLFSCTIPLCFNFFTAGFLEGSPNGPFINGGTFLKGGLTAYYTTLKTFLARYKARLPQRSPTLYPLFYLLGAVNSLQYNPNIILRGLTILFY